MLTEPRRPIFTVSPNRRTDVGFADQAAIGTQAARRHPLDQHGRAEGRRPFLVAGDDQADRMIMAGAGGGGDEGGDRALHVHRAAAVQPAVPHLAGPGRAGPALAGRHHVEMAGKGEVRAPASSHRQQVLDRPVRRGTHDEAVDGEADRGQRRRQYVEHRAARRRHAVGAQQRLGERQRVDRLHRFAASRRPAVRSGR